MQCFVVDNEKIIGNRIDPYYYSPSNICDIAKKTIFEVLELSEIAKLQRGKFSHRPRNDPKFFNGSYPFIQTGDIVKSSQNDLPIGYSQTLNDLGLSVSKLFSEKTILITIAANIGDTAILNYPACFPDSVVAIKPNKEFIKLEYLNIYLKFLKNYLNNLAPQAAQKNINLEQLSPTPIVIPPIETQEQIIGIMDKANNSKKKMEVEAERLLNEIDNYVLGELGIKITEVKQKKCFVVMSDEIKEGRIDPDYCVEKNSYKQTTGILTKTISELLKENFLVGKKGNPITRIQTVDGHIPVIAGGQSIPYYHNKSNFDKNIITISSSGAYAGYTWYHNYPIWASDCTVIYSSNENNLLTEYLYFFLKCQQQAIYKKQRGAGQPHIYLEDLKDLVIPLPSIEFQNKIVSEVKARIQKAEQLKEEAKSFLQKAKDEVEKMILGGY